MIPSVLVLPVSKVYLLLWLRLFSILLNFKREVQDFLKDPII